MLQKEQLLSEILVEMEDEVFWSNSKSYNLPVKKRPSSFQSHNIPIHVQSLGMTNVKVLSCNLEFRSTQGGEDCSSPCELRLPKFVCFSIQTQVTCTCQMSPPQQETST